MMVRKKRPSKPKQSDPFLSERFQAANPLRIARLARGWTQSDLAERTGITRVTIARMETGVSAGKTSTHRTLESHLSMRPGALQQQMQVWRDSFNPLDFVSPKGRAWLELPPEGVPEKFASWVNWRQNVAATTGHLARLLQISEEVIRDYEATPAGTAPRFPAALVSALSQRFGLSAEYIRELVLLPVKSRKPAPFVPKEPTPPRPVPGPGDYPWLR